MESKKYGYVRVSTKEQNIDRQMVAMDEVGIPSKDIFIDKISGKNFIRPAYKKLIRKLKPNDVMFIKSIDRLGRNYDEIIEQWRYLSKDKNIDIVVIDFPLLDTRNQQDELTGKFLADMVLQILLYVAQVERENTKQRQAEGIKEARKRGVKFGRPKLMIPSEFHLVYELWKNNQISQREGAKRLKTSNHTFAKWVDELEKNR